MQITLKQDEIESAIRSYVSGQVNIVEGNDVLIDLKAGRGPEGFTATIDIVPAGTKAAAPVEKAKPAKPAAPKSVPGLAPTAPAAETAQEAAEEAAAETATDGGAEAQDSGSEAEPAQEAPPAGTPAKSLFGNLQKPRNT